MSKSVFAWCIGLTLGLSINCLAAERPTFNKNTNDPRPDILPYWLHNGPTEYRRAYNRPRYIMGWLANVVEPSSQEAMVWCEAKQYGLYQKPHAPPMCRRYYAPRAWELLDTGPRPDFVRSPQRFELDESPAESINASPDVGLIDETTSRVQLANDILPLGR